MSNFKSINKRARPLPPKNKRFFEQSPSTSWKYFQVPRCSVTIISLTGRAILLLGVPRRKVVCRKYISNQCLLLGCLSFILFISMCGCRKSLASQNVSKWVQQRCRIKSHLCYQCILLPRSFEVDYRCLPGGAEATLPPIPQDPPRGTCQLVGLTRSHLELPQKLHYDSTETPSSLLNSESVVKGTVIV